MTTILVDRKKLIMGADRLSNTGDFKFKCAPKISYVHGDGYSLLVGTSGCAEASFFFTEWISRLVIEKTTEDSKHIRYSARQGRSMDNTSIDELYPRDGDFSALVLYSDRRLFLYSQKGAPIQIVSDVFGIGSGSAYAIGAYRAIGDIRKSIKIACDCDPQSGGGIQIESL